MGTKLKGGLREIRPCRGVDPLNEIYTRAGSKVHEWKLKSKTYKGIRDIHYWNEKKKEGKRTLEQKQRED